MSQQVAYMEVVWAFTGLLSIAKYSCEDYQVHASASQAGIDVLHVINLPCCRTS